MVMGHNNKLCGLQNSDQLIDTLVISGHNNRFEQLQITGNVIVSGHNNIFLGLKFLGAGSVQDTGINNKFQDCYQVQNSNAATQQQSQGASRGQMGDSALSDSSDEEIDEDEDENEYDDEEDHPTFMSHN